MRYIANELARVTASPAAQLVLSRDPALVRSLTQNPFLSDAMFAALYPNKKLPVADAKQLVSGNYLTDQQFEHVLAIETRATVINAMLASSDVPPADRLDKLLQSKAFSRQVSDKVVSDNNWHLSLAWVRAAALAVAGRARLELWLRSPADFTDAEIAAQLEVYSTWGPQPDGARLVQLLADRPGVIAGAARSDSPKVRTWAAGCRHLTRPADQLAVAYLDESIPASQRGSEWIDAHVFTFLALANNPVTSIDVIERCNEHLLLATDMEKRTSASRRLAKRPGPVTNSYETETDMFKVAWLLERCLPNSEGEGGRDHDLVAVLANPNLTPAEVLFAHRRLTSWATQTTAVAFDKLAARFPDFVQDRGIGKLAAPDTGTPVAPTPPQRTAPWTSVHAALTAGSRPAAQVRNNGPELRHLEQHLGESETAWMAALSLLDNGFPGTVAELVMVAQAAAA